ncbi:MAG: amidohydrolase family protein [Nitrososphaerota archaeon]
MPDWSDKILLAKKTAYMKLVLERGIILTFEDRDSIVRDGVLGISDDEIAFVGKEIPSWFAPDARINCDGCIIMPGLINTHVHLGEQALMGVLSAAGTSFEKMFYSLLFKLERNINPELVYWASLLAATEALKKGQTTVVDMYHHSEATACAVEQIGLRACIGQLIYGFSLRHPLKRGTFSFSYRDYEKQLASALDFACKWNGRGDGRITTALAPHATNTLEPSMLKEIAHVAKEHNAVIHMHVAQMKSEHEMVRTAYGCGCVELLDKTGILDNRFIGAHAIFLEPREFQLLARDLITVVNNPISNARDGGLSAPIAELKKAGVRVGIGTDAFHFDLLEAARFAVYIQRVRTADATLFSGYEVLRWITAESADGLGLYDVGRLVPGCKADLIVIDCNGLDFDDNINLYEFILHYISPFAMRLVLVNGKVIIENNKLITFDEEKIKKNFKKQLKQWLPKIYKLCARL